MFAEWAAFTVEDVQGFALAATGAPRTAGGYIMVQHVIDSLLVQQTPTWMESAELAMNFTLAGDEQPHSVTKCGFRLPGTDSGHFSVYVVPSEVTPILFGLDMIREFRLLIDASPSQYSISAWNPHDGDAFWTQNKLRSR